MSERKKNLSKIIDVCIEPKNKNKNKKKESIRSACCMCACAWLLLLQLYFFAIRSLLYAEMQFINCVRFYVKCSIAQSKCRPMSYIGRSTAIQIPIQCVWNELTIRHYTHSTHTAHTHFNWIDALRTHNFWNKSHHKICLFVQF